MASNLKSMYSQELMKKMVASSFQYLENNGNDSFILDKKAKSHRNTNLAQSKET